MNTITVVNKKNFTADHISIDRKTIYGNPFALADHGHDRALVINLYREYLEATMDKPEGERTELYEAMVKLLNTWLKREHIHLGCHCKPLDCHGDVIREMLFHLRSLCPLHTPGDWVSVMHCGAWVMGRITAVHPEKGYFYRPLYKASPDRWIFHKSAKIIEPAPNFKPHYRPGPTLSVRQPWAWAIFDGGKDIENRAWAPDFTGPMNIHVSKTLIKKNYSADVARLAEMGVKPPPVEQLKFGGYIGSVVVEEVLEPGSKSDSPWYTGEYGWVLSYPRRGRFVPAKGRQKLYSTPDWLTLAMRR